MEDIDASVGGVKVVFSPSDKEPSEHLSRWTLYDVYVEGEYMGLATDSGENTEDRSKERIWRALEGRAFQVGEALNRDEIAGTFVRWYYGARGGSGEWERVWAGAFPAPGRLSTPFYNRWFLLWRVRRPTIEV